MATNVTIPPFMESGGLDNSFGPAAPEGFDFTPLFENTLLSILPSAVLLLVLPFRLKELYGRSRKVSKSLLHGNKLVFLAVFTVLQAAILILYAANSAVRTPTTVAASALVFADAIGLCLLSHAEHVRSIRPSAIINAYLFITLIFDVARARTLWISGAPTAIAAVFTVATIVKLLVAVAEAVEKRRILLSPYQNVSPETTGGLYSRSFFWWLNTLMRTGFQRTINENDLFPIEDEMGSSYLRDRAQAQWQRTDKTASNALFWAILKVTRRQLALCIFPRVCLIGFRYAQPFLLSRTVEFVNSAEDSDNIGWGLTGAFGFVFLGMAVASGSYYHMSYRFVTTVRGCLVGIIYTKTVDLSVISLDESAALTLMSNDAEAICQGFQSLHEIWAVPIELGIATWLLQRQLGVSFLGTAGVAIISTLSVFGISRYVGGSQKIWNQAIQTRVDVTTSILGSMKAVKILGFTDRLTEILQGLRVRELKLSRLFRRLLCARVFFANSMRGLAPLATLIVFVLVSNSTGRQLDTSTAYTTLSLIALLNNPLNTLLRTIPMLHAALACFHRIQKFLESDARQCHVLPLKIDPDSRKVQAVTVTGLDTEGGEGIELQNLSLRRPRSSNSAIIDVRNASFAWSLDSSPTINDVSFSVLRQNFLFVIGPVGCGKSTLLKGLMSETPSSKGFVYSDASEIAFVDQTPWIQNTTIKNNIVGQSTFDEAWFDEVVRACTLDYDIAAAPSGADSIVGSRGISLSGGQKQRLAMARALYAKKELMIIDDSFSGLDAETEEKVFVRLFSKHGLLRRLGTTVIIVTHAVHRLPYADHIVALTSTGHVAEQGTFHQLRNSGGYVEGLATKHKYDNSSMANEKPNTDIGPQAETLDINKAKADDDESLILGGDLSTYKYYFASIGWPTTFISLSFFLVAAIAAKLSELILTYWTSAVAIHGNQVNSLYLGIYSLVGVLGIATYNVGVYHFFLYLLPHSAEELHARLLHAVMGAPLHFFASTDTGTTTNRFSQDMSVVDQELSYALIDFLLSFFVTVMGAILMCVSAGYFTLTMPAVLFVVWVLQKYYLRTSRHVRVLDLEAKAPLYTHFIESLSGLVTIRAFGWSEEFIQQNLVLLDASQKPYYLLFCIQRWLSLVLDLMVSVLAVILMVIVVKLRASIGPGYVGLALLNVMGFSESLAWAIRQWTGLETSIGAVARLKNFATLTPNENLPDEIQPVPLSWPTHGVIELRNVSASYTESGTLILKDINMSIRGGEKIGICGRSGSGKSSLTMTLFRMLELSPSSSIIVDGIDIATIPRQAVRSRFNAIPQDPFFMRGSIRLNASPETTHDDTTIVSALRKVHLWPIIETKGGLDADLDAEFFSHGQRQLFCLARALLRESQVVVLDEVSSSIDVTTDKLMQQVIREEFAGKTIIAVAHRLDTILDFDRIAVLRDGRIVEFDEPAVLLENRGAFWELYNS